MKRKSVLSLSIREIREKWLERQAKKELVKSLIPRDRTAWGKKTNTFAPLYNLN